jgi:hypothetical protein
VACQNSAREGALDSRAGLAGMRTIVILGLFIALSACAETGEGASFRDPQSGAVVHACGPYPGFADAVAAAEQGCAEAYESAGWKRVEAH